MVQPAYMQTANKMQQQNHKHHLTTNIKFMLTFQKDLYGQSRSVLLVDDLIESDIDI